MADEKHKSEPALYRADTVPPPDGETDAYNAPTKVGPIASSTLAEMMKAVESQVVSFNAGAEKTPEATARSDERPTSKPPAEAPAEAAPASPRPSPAPPPPDPEVVKLSEDDDDDGAATLLSSFAKGPSLGSSSSAEKSNVLDDLPPASPALAPPMVRTKGKSRTPAVLIIMILAIAALAIYYIERH
jgi:hypothetical protein